MNNPLVSIVTPVYNSQEFLEDTLKSVLSQSYTNWEHILVDDGSTDSSINIIENNYLNDNRFKLLKRNRLPKGRSTSRNIGITAAKGKYIVFLDSDDLLKPFCLEKRVRTFEKEDKLNFIVFQMEMFLPSGEIRSTLSTLYSQNYLSSFLSLNFPWNVTCPIWKLSFLQTNNLFFDERLSNIEDPLLHTQALLLNNANYLVLYEKEYIDCQYRVDYKPVDLKNQINSSIYFIEKISLSIKDREDKTVCDTALNIAYTTLLSHYCGQDKKDLYANIDEMQNWNNCFLRFKLINSKQSTKTRIFLKLLKSKMFENDTFVKFLSILGFNNFYCFTFNRFKDRK